MSNEKTKVREGNCNPRNGWLMWSRTVNGRLQYVLTQDDGRSYRTAVVIYPNEKKADGRINSDEDKSNNYSIILSQLLAK